MEKGQHGYMNRHKRNVLISIIILGLFVIVGVFFTVAMFNTRKTIFIIIPILVALPLAKQLVAYIMCAGFRELTDEEYSKIKKIWYFGDPSLVYDVSISRYEGIVYFPAAVVRDGRMLFYYNGGYGKKIQNETALKNIITEAFADQKKYVVIVTTDIESFVAKANKIKEPTEEFVGSDERIRNRLYELGI